ncbi:MAG: LuxR C-terminal-related transcriptional regulator, partial [Bacteroidota bacterium]
NLLTTIELALHQFASEQQSLFPTPEHFTSQLNVRLTKREYELLQSLFEGLSYKEIATKHYISVNTVKSYLKADFQFLKNSSRHEAVNLILQLK